VCVNERSIFQVFNHIGIKVKIHPFCCNHSRSVWNLHLLIFRFFSLLVWLNICTYVPLRMKTQYCRVNWLYLKTWSRYVISVSCGWRWVQPSVRPHTQARQQMWELKSTVPFHVLIRVLTSAVRVGSHGTKPMILVLASTESTLCTHILRRGWWVSYCTYSRHRNNLLETRTTPWKAGSIDLQRTPT